MDATRLDPLNQIARAAGACLTGKPPQPNGKNANRWLGLKNLLEQIGPLVAARGGKTVDGPTDFKAINHHAHSHWLEALDPQHRPGYKPTRSQVLAAVPNGAKGPETMKTFGLVA